MIKLPKIGGGWLLTFFCIAFSLSTSSAQNICSSATPLPASNNLAHATTSLDEVWFSFIAPNNEVLLTYSVTMPGYSDMETVTVYQAPCNTPLALNTGTIQNNQPKHLSLPLSGLIIGNVYYIQLIRPTPCSTCPQQARFNLSVRSLSALAYWGLIVRDTVSNYLGSCFDSDILSSDLQPTDCGLIMTICPNKTLSFWHDTANYAYNLGTEATGIYAAGWQINGGSCNGNYIDTTLQSFTCNYSTPGIYTVKLYYFWRPDTTQPYTLLGGVEIAIEVKAPIQANLSVTGLNACLSDTLRLYSSGVDLQHIQFYVDGIPYANCVGSANILDCDSMISFDNSHPFYYPPFTGGTHTVSLVVWDGCSRDSVSQIIHFGPKANFTFNNDCRVRFDDASTCPSDIVAWNWNFGDVASGIYNTAAGQSVWHNFTTPGTPYLVTLTITLSDGTQSTFSQYVTAPFPPDATISGSPVNNCGNGTITYSAPCDPNMIYTWQVIGGTGTVSANGCSIDVNWSANGGSLILYVSSFPLDCTNSDTIFVAGCCNIGQPYSTSNTTGKIYLNNRTASSVLSDPLLAPFISGNTFTSAPPNDIVINGIFTVDVPFEFVNCPSVNPGTNAVLDVLAGQSLTFDNSRVAATCDMMWDGIYVHGNSASVIVKNNSLIQQSKNGIVSLAGGHYDVENSTLQNNVYDIQVKQYYQTHTGTVRGSLFTMNAAFLPAFPALPSSVVRTLEAIRIETNADITIGDPTSVTTANTFRRVNVGIHAMHSNVNVQNCHFRRIDFGTPHGIISGHAILAEGTKNPVFSTIKTTVGGFNAGEACTFDTCRIPVSARDHTDLYAHNNLLSGTSAVGIEVLSCPLRTISLSGNTITNQVYAYRFQTAIQMVEIPDASISILQNNIQQSGVNNTLQQGIGIYVANVVMSPVTLLIDSNLIARVKAGIVLSNIKSFNGAFVTNNTIQFAKANSFYNTTSSGGHGVHYGIRLNYCKDIRVDTNYVTKTSTTLPVLPMIEYLRGVSLENSARSVVSDNVFDRMGSGIYALDICSNSTLACNTFNTCYYGCYFRGSSSSTAAADIGDQIINPQNQNIELTGNVFNGSISDDIRGNVTIGTLWHDNPLPNVPSFTGLTFGTSGNNICGLFLLAQSEDVKRDQQVGAILNDLAAGVFDTEQEYYLIKQAYTALRENPHWLTLGTPDDARYQSFFATCESGNWDELIDAENAASQGDTMTIATFTGGSVPANSAEENAQIVLNIYAKYWLAGHRSFTPADTAILLHIALQNPVLGGNAVYGARVLLGLMVDDFAAAGIEMRQSNTIETTISAVIYPNPATTSLFIEIGDEIAEQIDITVIDMSGRTVLSAPLQKINGQFVLDIEKLAAGSYFMTLKVGEDTIRFPPIIIADQP
jgi:parallel beta-helix repeat protein